ncbi:MAG: FAD-dependent oxidoreductase [Acidobacteriota bacterium]|nr:FAD-dependent oxidoreductase [Acidobacteriota bacterium]
MTTHQAGEVLIIGANFAGLAAAGSFSSAHKVTVVDASPYLEFLPNIHELISGFKSPELLRTPKKRLIDRMGHSFLEEKVIELDPGGCRAITESGKTLNFDVCIVAIGGVNDTYGIPGAAEHGLPLKSVADGREIYNRLSALVQDKPECSVVIVGGGLEGVESLGEVLRRYRSNKGLRVHLVEKETVLLIEEPKALDREIRKRLRKLPVTFHTGQRVVEVEKDKLTLASGEVLPADLTIWTGGAAPNPLLAQAGLASGPNRWAMVNKSLQSEVHENIFVAGDAAELPRPLAKQAYYALDMGRCAAANARRRLRGKTLQPLCALPRPSLIALGDLDTYLVFGRLAVAGKGLAGLKEVIFQYNMSKQDPPLAWPSLFELQERLWSGFSNLILPRIFSPFSIPELGVVRLLSL